MDSEPTKALKTAFDLINTEGIGLPALTKAMRALAVGLFTLTDAEKDDRRDAYLALRTAALAKDKHAPAAATDPWAWEDYLALYEERNGYAYTGSACGITAAMVCTYLEIDGDEA